MTKHPSDNEQRQENLRLLELAEQDQAEAKNALGARLATGTGTEIDLPGALYWYARAIALGYTHSKWNAGTMFIAGEGIAVPKEELGMLLIEQAAESGETAACGFLSQCYKLGRYGKKIDQQLSVEWQTYADDWERFVEYGTPIALNEYRITPTKPVIV